MRTETERLVREALDVLTGEIPVPYLDKIAISVDILNKALEVEPVGRDSAWNLAERSGKRGW